MIKLFISLSNVKRLLFGSQMIRIWSINGLYMRL